ncbi:MAG TPA: hypothetical protein VFP13_05065 [Actinomycetota bacterium]|nr:hypothetical protein [Actinomycetota bacterium]
MRSRFGIATIGAVVSTLMVAGVMVAGVAAAGGSAATKLTIRGPNGDFHGRLLSEDTSCLGDRRVSVFEQLGDEQSPSTDDRIASDTSERDGDHGVWSVGNTGFRDGFFYAKVGRSPGCRGDRSKTIELVDGVPQ